MSNRLRDNIIKKSRRAIDFAQKAMAFPCTIYYRTGNKLECSTCTFDPVNRETTDPDCPECQGNHYLDEIKTKIINMTSCRVGISNQFTTFYAPGGQYDIEDVYVGALLSDVLIDPSKREGETLFHRMTKLVMNNGDILVKKTTPLSYGFAGDLYKCGLICRVDNTNQN